MEPCNVFIRQFADLSPLVQPSMNEERVSVAQGSERDRNSTKYRPGVPVRALRLQGVPAGGLRDG
jgi:hypothetical protein